MIAPQTSEAQRRLIYHGYSAQAFGIFHGDLDYYFYRDSLKGKSWDGRNRVDTIDTKLCPIVGLCGAYDWSNTPAMAKATMDKIKGGHYMQLEGLGHFPATENPQAFARYFLQALDLLGAAK
jgi:pimeloyl-ACP methyl ester carboxylesterase